MEVMETFIRSSAKEEQGCSNQEKVCVVVKINNATDLHSSIKAIWKKKNQCQLDVRMTGQISISPLNFLTAAELEFSAGYPLFRRKMTVLPFSGPIILQSLLHSFINSFSSSFTNASVFFCSKTGLKHFFRPAILAKHAGCA